MKFGWQIGIIVIAIGVGLYFSRKPWEVYREQKAKAEAASVEMSEAERERVRLMGEKARLNSALGKEEAIRAKNWRKPGETAVEER